MCYVIRRDLKNHITLQQHYIITLTNNITIIFHFLYVVVLIAGSLMFMLPWLHFRYYNKDGGPTKEWYKVQKLLGQKEKMEAERKELEKRFPGCNSHWNKQEGGTVFCSEKR